MNNKKTVIRFFTIADYEDEEIWLHNQHMSGWKLVKMIPPCFFVILILIFASKSNTMMDYS